MSHIASQEFPYRFIFERATHKRVVLNVNSFIDFAWCFVDFDWRILKFIQSVKSLFYIRQSNHQSIADCKLSHISSVFVLLGADKCSINHPHISSFVKIWLHFMNVLQVVDNNLSSLQREHFHITSSAWNRIVRVRTIPFHIFKKFKFCLKAKKRFALHKCLLRFALFHMRFAIRHLP